MPAPHGSTLFPYTTLFRSIESAAMSHDASESNRCADAMPHPRAMAVKSTLARALGVGCAPVTSYTPLDRKSTRLNSSHLGISYAVFCLKKKKTKQSSQPIY